MTGRGQDARRRRGFSLLELLVVNMLMLMLATLLAIAWSTVGRAASYVLGRGRIANEASLAAYTLARDLDGKLGISRPGPLVGVRSHGDGAQFQVCFDGPPLDGTADWGDLVATADAVVTYSVSYPATSSDTGNLGGLLTRSDASGSFVVARYLSGLASRDAGKRTTLDLTFTYPPTPVSDHMPDDRVFKRTFHLSAVNQP